jgi:hypothetical protein
MWTWPIGLVFILYGEVFSSANVVDKAESFGECKDLNEVLVERIREQKVRNSDKIPRKTLLERK